MKSERLMQHPDERGHWKIVYQADEHDLPYIVELRGSVQARFGCETDAYRFIRYVVGVAKGNAPRVSG